MDISISLVIWREAKSSNMLFITWLRSVLVTHVQDGINTRIIISLTYPVELWGVFALKQLCCWLPKSWQQLNVHNVCALLGQHFRPHLSCLVQHCKERVTAKGENILLSSGQCGNDDTHTGTDFFIVDISTSSKENSDKICIFPP